MKFEYTTESLYVINRFEGIIRHYWSDYSNRLAPLKQFTDFEWGNSRCIANLPYLKYLEYDAFIFVGTSKAINCYRGNWHERRVIPDSATAKFMMTMFNLLDKPSLSIVLGPDQYSYSINNKYRPNLNLIPFYNHKLLRFLLDEFKLKGYKNILVHSNIESDGTIDFSKDIKYLLNLFKEYEE